MYKFQRKTFCHCSDVFLFSLPLSFRTHLDPGAKNSLHRSLTSLCGTVGEREPVSRLADFLQLHVLAIVAF